jgi:hypothetical protein
MMHHPRQSFRWRSVFLRAIAIQLVIVAFASWGVRAFCQTISMQSVTLSNDGRSFVYGESKTPFVPWGFNYLGEFGKLMEDTWGTDWDRVERDLREMRKLGANVVRIHLQFGTYMTGPSEFEVTEFDRLKKLLDLGREVGLYFDLTGLSCYRLDRIPAWYDALDESERWDIQAQWWKMVAQNCAGHPALFCYDLMNEPIVGGQAKQGEPRWVGGELGGFYFVQRISEAPKGRSNIEIAEAWASKLTKAIREVDSKTLITVGVIPWAQVWPNAKPVFYSPEASKHFDFVSIHAYPGKAEVDRAIAAVAVYDIGKPLVIEETFTLQCSIDEMNQFVDGCSDRVEGWIGHYFGYTIEEHRQSVGQKSNGSDPFFHTIAADFLGYWREKGKKIANALPASDVSSDQPKR